jgi:hypothetical protein
MATRSPQARFDDGSCTRQTSSGTTTHRTDRQPGRTPYTKPSNAFSITSGSAGWIQYWPSATSFAV